MRFPVSSRRWHHLFYKKNKVGIWCDESNREVFQLCKQKSASKIWGRVPYIVTYSRAFFLQRGYTFVAEAHTMDQALLASRWRMRLIGCRSPLPTPFRNEVNSSFHTRELRDYYMPNKKNIILRHTVKVTEDHVASIQITTSKSDVYVKLMVLDNEEEVTSSIGKGHVVLPAFIFQKDCTGEEESKRSSSRACEYCCPCCMMFQIRLTSLTLMSHEGFCHSLIQLLKDTRVIHQVAHRDQQEQTCWLSCFGKLGFMTLHPVHTSSQKL